MSGKTSDSTESGKPSVLKNMPIIPDGRIIK